MKSDMTGVITMTEPPEELTASFDVVALDRDRTIRGGAEACVEESVNLLLNGTRVASLAMTLVCFARPPRMSVYSGRERIRNLKLGGN